jgi:hypothetical protein
MLLLGRDHAPESRADTDPHLLMGFPIDIKTGVRDRHLGRTHGELGVTIQAPYLLSVEIWDGVEIHDFGRYLAAVGANIERGNAANG